MKIDFVSDVACPWCAVGLFSLEQALARIGGEVAVELHFQPFELNPAMAAQGEDAIEHLSRKYGATPAQLAIGRKALVERGAALGFTFGEPHRVWNTFAAHRLMHCAGLEGRQRELKHALLVAYHTRGENVGASDVLARCAREAGLDPAAAREVIESDRYGDEVRQSEAEYQRLGIRAVPSVIIDGKHLLQGAQPVDVFEGALRELAAAR